MGSNTNKRRSAKRGILIALVVFLSIVLAVLLAGTIFASRLLNSIEKVDPNQETMSQEQIDAILKEEIEPTDPDFTGEAFSSDDVLLSDTPVGVVQTGDDVINILLVGQDTENLSQRSRSDSMILCTINKTTKTLTMTSFMRDMYVKIPQFYDQRLNVAYLLGGFDALYDTLEHNFGVQVDNGVAVNFASFQKVIDAVGGVEVKLTAAEANHLNMQNYTWGLFEGVNILTGETALAYSRIRALGGDFDRTNRQRTVLLALLNKAMDMPVTELYNLVEALIPMVVTDMSNTEIVAAAMDLAPMLQDLEIISQRIPVDDGYNMTMVDGMSVLLPDLEMNREFLVDTIGIDE